MSPSGGTRAACRASAGPFDLDDYIDYIIEFIRYFQGDVHVMAVCQPTVPVFAAVSLLEADAATAQSRAP